jgi:hypothetical protein
MFVDNRPFTVDFLKANSKPALWRFTAVHPDQSCAKGNRIATMNL